MLSAIQELADGRPDEREEHLATLEYLTALNLLFEQGILSNDRVNSLSSHVLVNMEKGFTYFSEWRRKVNVSGEGTMIVVFMQVCMSVHACS